MPCPYHITLLTHRHVSLFCLSSLFPFPYILFYSFPATIDDLVVVAEAQETQQAHKAYQEAIEHGNTAYLMKELKADIFKVQIGNLPSKKTVVVKITYQI
jgi:Vault protein inter-alpha-trypsin domain